VSRVVVGLGNAGEHLRASRHNVGHRVIDRLGRELRWRQEGEALIAEAELDGAQVHLVKLAAPTGAIGAAATRLAQRLGVGPQNLVMVHDDMDLPLGTVRARLRGAAGGHRHMTSILEAFQTDLIPRVKLGIGRPRGTSSIHAHVLSAFEADETATLEAACAEAAERVRWLLALRRSSRSPAPPP
jgi:PTH1 family peptidyl-tRNA hydrolase